MLRLSVLRAKFAPKEPLRPLLRVLELLVMKLVSFTTNLAPQVTRARPRQLAHRSLPVNTPPRVTMAPPPPTVTVATLALLALSAPCKQRVLMAPITSQAPLLTRVQHVQLAHTATKLSKLLASPVCIVISQLMLPSTNSALLALTLLLAAIMLPAQSAMVDTLATSVA